MNHSTLQRGMLHTAAERETATEGDRGGRGAGEGDLGVGEGPGGGVRGGGGRGVSNVARLGARGASGRMPLPRAGHPTADGSGG